MNRVLVVDDDADSRFISTLVLRAQGYEVTEAGDGEEALVEAERSHPDAVLLDLTMPRLSGWEVARKLKAMPGSSGSRIIAFSAHALTGSREEALESGCDAYLSKPCSTKDIVRAVREALEGTGERKPS